MKKRALAVFMALCVVLSFVGTALISTFTTTAEATSETMNNVIKGDYIGFLKLSPVILDFKENWIKDLPAAGIKVKDPAKEEESTVPNIYIDTVANYEKKDFSNSIVAYCFNRSLHNPFNQEDGTWNDSNSLDESSIKTNARNYYTKISDDTGDVFADLAKYEDTSLTPSELRTRLISIVLNGYPMDASGYGAEAKLTDSEFRVITQWAVWRFTDHTYSSSGYTEALKNDSVTPENDKATEVYNKLISTDLSSSVLKDAETYFDLYSPTGAAYDGDSYQYQNLLAVNYSLSAQSALQEEVAKSLASLKVTKVVDVGQTGKDITNETFTFTIKVTDENGTAIDLTEQVSDQSVVSGGSLIDKYTITAPTTASKTISGNGNNVLTVQLKNGESVEIEGLPDGYKYEVEETGNNLSSYTTSVNNNGTTVTTSRKVTGSGAAKTTANVTYTNTVIPTRTLTLKKVTAYAKDADQTFTFTVTLKDKDRNSAIANYSVVDTSDNSTLTTADANGEATVTLKNGQTAAISGLPSEGYSYTISETKVADFSTSVTANNAAVTPSTDDNKITVTGTETANTTLPIVFTNTQDTGKLTVSKTVSFSEDDEKNVPQTLITDAKTTKEYTFTVALKNGDNAYTTANTVYLVGSDGALTSQTISDEGKVTVVLKGESSCTLQIPAGLTYTVTEAAVDNFITTSTGATGTITKDNPSTAAFTNTFSNKKNVVVTKTWVHGNILRTPLDLVIDLIQSVTSTVPPEAEGGQSTTTITENTISGENITHTVDDKNSNNWIYTFADMVLYANGYEVTYTASEPNVPEGYTASVDTSSNVITNTFNENNLTTLKITKAFDGSTTPDREFTFTISLSDKTYNGTLTITRNDDKDYSDTVTMTGGTATVKLKVGDTVTIPQVYSNTTYTVKEQSLYGYRVKKVERTVTAKAADAQKEPETDTKTYTSTYTGTTTATPSMVHLTFTNEVYYPASAVSSSEASEDESSSEPEDDTSSQPEESSKPTDSSSKPTSSKPTSSKPSAPNKGTTSSNDAEEGDSDGSNKHGNNNAEKGNSSSKTDGTSTGSTGGTAASGTSQNKGTTAAQGGADSNTTTGQGGTAADQNNPSTGDTSYVMFWTIGAIGSVIAAGMVGIILVAMKRRK
jgi:TQXA domain-containing protein